MSGQLVSTELIKKKVILVESGSVDFKKDIQELNNHKSVGLEFRKDNINRIRQLGGSANLWANQLMLLSDNDFEKRNWIDYNCYNPLSYKELKKYYERAITKVYKNKFKEIGNLVNFKRGCYSLFENEFLKDNNLKFNNHFWPSKVEKFNYNSKFTRAIINSKNIDFLNSYTATDFEIDENLKKVTSIKFIFGKKEIVINANFFVLACGAIENARLLLNNRSKSKLLENHNIGKYFMEHPRVNLGELQINKNLPLNFLFGVKHYNYSIRHSLSFSKNYLVNNELLNSYVFLDPKFDTNEELYFNEFIHALKIIFKNKKIPKYNFRNFKLKSFIEQIYFNIPAQISSNSLNNLIRIYFQITKSKFSFNKININYQGEQLPNFNSSINLISEKDFYNQKKIEIDWNLTDKDYDTIKHFIKIFHQKFKNHRYLSFKENNEKIITDASHHMGTTRMSLNDNDGVVDKNCKFHKIKNLFISGNSVLRTSGSSNPGLTNMALSLRLGEYINNL
tara:strand:+ start:4905 stop:6425 length:1521 start_codon:yes stop_codon:yes gene_type:complete